MKRSTFRCLGWRLIAAALAQASIASASAQPAAELFFRPPEIESAVLSPSGRWLALTVNQASGYTVLAVIDPRGGTTPLGVTGFSDADVTEVRWVDDDWLVFYGAQREASGRYLSPRRWLYSARRDGSEQHELPRRQRRPDTGVVFERGAEPYYKLLYVPRDGSGDVIVGHTLSDATGEPLQVLPQRIHAQSGRMRNVEALPPGRYWHWWFAPGGEPRVALAGGEGRRRLHVRDVSSKQWKLIAEYDAWKAPFFVEHLGADGELLVAVPRGEGNTTELARFDFTTGKPSAESLVRTPGFDFTGYIVTEYEGGRALGVRVVTDAETTVWYDKRLAELQKEVDGKLTGQVNRLDCRRCEADDMVVLIHSYSDRDPGRWHLYEAKDKSWRSIGVMRRAIDPMLMGRTSFFRIAARDKRDLPLWLTFPPGPRRPAPAVVLVHGGPWVRGSAWRWDGIRQFLASRGYVVVEPEFRGTAGYGAQHFHASQRQWGKAMQDDVADALLWATEQGHVEKGRACIAGGSYGGYAALMGLVRHPELYRCAAAWVAVTDPRLLFEWHRDTDVAEDARRFDLPQMLGDPRLDVEALRDAAPIEHAAHIKAPVLLAFGATDQRVPIKHGTRMRDALRDAGNDPEWVVYNGEGHEWRNAETRIDFALRLERFLAKHLAR